MVITRTPYRMSFFGGGTDYPSWYQVHGGSVLATTINKYCYISARYLPPFFEHRFRIVWSRTERVHSIEEIQHPAVREGLRHLGFTRGMEVHHDGDLPARSGVGSSSSFMVGFLNALYAMQGRMQTKQRLAEEAIHIEREVLKETVGSQDQVSAAFGGLNHIQFLPDGGTQVQPITIPQTRLEELNAHLMLLFTGLNRSASDVAASYAHDLQKREAQMHLIGGMVEEGISILNSGRDLKPFGQLLNEGWRMKRMLSESITNDHVEDLYERARGAGAVGGKLLGAGGGGFMLLFAEPEAHVRVREALGNTLHVPFKFDKTGSQVIYYDPQEDFEAVEAERNRFFERLPTAAGA